MACSFRVCPESGFKRHETTELKKNTLQARKHFRLPGLPDLFSLQNPGRILFLYRTLQMQGYH